MDTEKSILALIDEAPSLIFEGARRKTFSSGKFVFDQQQGAKCTGELLAKAGFYFTGTRADPSAATCAFCLKEMLFDAADDPWEEHVSHCPDCLFVQFAVKNEMDMTVHQLLELCAFRRVRSVVKWQQSKLSGFKEAVQYVAKMQPK